MYLMPCLDCSDLARSASVHGVTASKWTHRPPPIRSTQYLPVGLTLRVRPKYCRVAPSRKKVTGLPTEVSTAVKAEAVDAARRANADELAAVVTVAEVQGLFGDDTAAGLLPRLVALTFAFRGGVPGKGSAAASTAQALQSPLLRRWLCCRHPATTMPHPAWTTFVRMVVATALPAASVKHRQSLYLQTMPCETLPSPAPQATTIAGLLAVRVLMRLVALPLEPRHGSAPPAHNGRATLAAPVCPNL